MLDFSLCTIHMLQQQFVLPIFVPLLCWARLFSCTCFIVGHLLLLFSHYLSHVLSFILSLLCISMVCFNPPLLFTFSDTNITTSFCPTLPCILHFSYCWFQAPWISSLCCTDPFRSFSDWVSACLSACLSVCLAVTLFLAFSLVLSGCLCVCICFSPSFSFSSSRFLFPCECCLGLLQWKGCGPYRLHPIKGSRLRSHPI